MDIKLILGDGTFYQCRPEAMLDVIVGPRLGSPVSVTGGGMTAKLGQPTTMTADRISEIFEKQQTVPLPSRQKIRIRHPLAPHLWRVVHKVES